MTSWHILAGTSRNELLLLAYPSTEIMRQYLPVSTTVLAAPAVLAAQIKLVLLK